MTYGSVSDRRVAYAPHDWLNSYVCVTVERSDVSKFTEGSRQGSFTVKMKEQFLRRNKVGNHDIHGQKKATHAKLFRSRHLGENQRD